MSRCDLVSVTVLFGSFHGVSLCLFCASLSLKYALARTTEDTVMPARPMRLRVLLE